MQSPSASAHAEQPPVALAPARSRAERAAWRHPAVLVLAPLLAALCFVRYGLEARAFISAFTVAVLVVLSATDLEERLIPNRIVLPAAAVVLAAQLAFYPDQTGEWVLSASGAALFLFLPTIVRRGAIGMGDVKLALLLGASLGYMVLSALTLGFLALVPVALYMLVREGSEARHKYLPLGPFLAFGTVFVLLLGGAN